jgi:type I restriction enzyme S subunit
MKSGWTIEQLGEIATINYGYTDSAKSEAVGPRFLRITDIQNENVDWDAVPFCSIDDEGLNKYRLRSGDIVFARTGATTGKSFLVQDPPESVFASYLIRLRLNDRRFLPQFVSYFLQTPQYWQAIRDGSSGSAQGGFNATKLGALSLPAPPVLEQKRIVGILDEAFEGIAVAKANAEKNLQNARALFENHLQAVLTQHRPSWVEKPLGEVFATSTGTTPPKNNSDFYGEFMPLVKPPELCDAPIDSALDNISEAGSEVARILPPQSILVSCIGNLGKIGINTVPVAFNQQINAILPDERKAIPEFIFLQAISSKFKDQLESLASGTTVPIVNKSKFNSVRIALPPLSEQKTIAAQLNSLRELAKHLESIYQEKLTALDKLKKSLLHEAFTGKL